MAKAIKVENLSKAYELGEIGTGTISNDLKRFWANVRGHEDPFMKIGEVNDRTVKSKGSIVWSLKDLNFEARQGDAIGIIGRNGAGKSTLLKILSRVTSPTAGSVKIRGRISSLLEVGTGFHPELTGKENIYLNGAILGMRKAEIKRKFDEIVDFSGVERYIDTPVKRYSSGMYVRLAFAVAANLESEILVVDEVLAVGDVEFQKKCLNKMGDVSRGEGRTILFVSHNMASIQKLCNSCIILNNGSIFSQGNVDRCISAYLDFQKPQFIPKTVLDDNYSIKDIKTFPDHVRSHDELVLSFTLTTKSRRQISNIIPILYNVADERICIMDLRKDLGVNIRLKENEDLAIAVNIASLPVMEDEYTLGLYLKDEIVDKDFTDIYKIVVHPQLLNKEESFLEYGTEVRGKINLKFNASRIE